nr:OadG family protein [uncultured Caproiciproducens sp.]
MSLEQKIQLSIIILLTGIVIVFSMLIFLTFVIKGYGAVVKKLQSNHEDHKDSVQPVVSPSPSALIPVSVQSVQTGISEETVAAISAAVYTLYGTSAGKVTSIRRAAQPNRSAWGMAGLLENTRPF